jgi:hypothetical protein
MIQRLRLRPSTRKLPEICAILSGTQSFLSGRDRIDDANRASITDWQKPHLPQRAPMHQHQRALKLRSTPRPEHHSTPNTEHRAQPRSAHV